tara:strand:- start:377 stop:3031 length:2655 start_codon:yes stop_codon:yes gene_type:complete
MIDAGYEPNLILPPGLEFRNNRFKKVDFVDFSNVRRITSGEVGGRVGIGYLRSIMKQYIGQTIRRIRRVPGQPELDKDEIIFVPENFSSWWGISEPGFFWIKSDTFLFDPDIEGEAIILNYDKVDAENIDQYFLDGVSHCFFQPLKNWGSECLSKATSVSGEKRYKSFCNKVDTYEMMYPSGVPVKDIQSIVEHLQIKVTIDVPGDKELVSCVSSKKPRKTFNFINTRLNHIELNELSSKDDPEEVSCLDPLFNELKEKGEFFLWKTGVSGIRQINTLQKKYVLKNAYTDAVKEFNHYYDIMGYKIDHKKQTELSQFLLDNVNPNLSINFNYKDHDIYPVEDTKEYQVLDMKRAYSQGYNCTYYKGYLGKITDFRKCDRIMGLGIYNIKNVRVDNPALEKLNYIHAGNAYPSPELEFFRDNGVSFDITHGCWGSRFDMKFDDTMMEKDTDGVRYYQKWYGCMMCNSSKERYNFYCPELDYAKVIQYYSKDSTIRWNSEEKCAILEYDAKHNYHGSHIAAFITSYCRISLMEQVMKFKDLDQIKGVVVDGIYYEGDVDIHPLFKLEEKKRMKFQGSTSYLNYNSNDEISINCRENNRIEVHLGGGGCGKTHTNLTDKGLVNTLFIAPSWKLARKKQTDYDISATVYQRIIHDDPSKWKPFSRFYNVFIIDEVSMLNNEDKELIINRFPEHKIIFCGDIGYQLPPIEGEEFKIGDLPVIEYTTNYRCQCNKLRTVLNALRDELSKEQPFVTQSGDEWFGKKVISVEDMDYKVEDLIISSTNWACWESEESFTNRYKDLKKYLVQNNTPEYSNGDIIIGDPPGGGVVTKLRHAFTIHSIQGETAQNKLFIDLRGIMHIKMLYTAISRAQYWDQIVFVRNNFKKRQYF